ncbi:MAG: hypothetical protein PHX21_12610 [bacterium]|nr:hypothetical protein [bacterium]
MRIGITIVMLLGFCGCVKEIPRQETPEEINAQLFGKNYYLVEVGKITPTSVDLMNAQSARYSRELDNKMAGLQKITIEKDGSATKGNNPVADKGE